MKCIEQKDFPIKKHFAKPAPNNNHIDSDFSSLIISCH